MRVDFFTIPALDPEPSTGETRSFAAVLLRVLWRKLSVKPVRKPYMASRTAFFVAALGTVTPGTAAPPLGTGTTPRTGTTTSASVFPELSTGPERPCLTRLPFPVLALCHRQNTKTAGALVGGQRPCENSPAVHAYG